MTRAIFDEVQKAAASMGSCDPLWLRQEQEPTFRTVEGGNQGPEMVLLHGLFGALSNWDSVFPLFSQYSRPMALSLPILDGHRSWVKVKALAAFTQYFVLKRQLAPTVLCGNSLGGHVAMRLCLAAPHLVDCMILSGTSGLYEHSVDTLPVRPDKKFIRDHMARVFYDRKFITEEAIDEIHKIVVDRGNVLNIIHAARSAKKDNLLNLLKQIKVPVLLLWGEDDQVTTMDVAELFAKHIPNSTLVTIKGCGHAPMIEKPEWFSEHVGAFLKKHSRFYKSA